MLRDDTLRIVRTRRGARLVQDDAVLSVVLDRPGPTHRVFDVLAAAVVALAPGPRSGLLGFAAGGIVAPLRALGWKWPIEAVDRSLEGAKLYRELAGGWGGEVRLAPGDALAWLRRRRGRFDALVEDLSIASSEGVVKPPASFGPLPGLLSRRLAPNGVAIVNLLPLAGRPWRELIEPVAAPHRRAAVVLLDDYQNRLVLAGDRLPPASRVARLLGAELRRLGSRMAGRLAVRTLRPG